MTTDSMFMCFVCEPEPTTYLSEIEFNRHKVFKHGIEYTLVDPVKRFVCLLCTRSFSSNVNLKHHQVKIHGNLSNLQLSDAVACMLCTHKKIHLSTSKMYNTHMSQFHENEIPINFDSLPKVCKWCNSIFAERDKLLVHLNTCTAGFSCTHCISAKFETEKSLQSHFKMFHEEKRTVFNCKVCSKPYQSKRAVLVHETKGKCTSQSRSDHGPPHTTTT